MGVVEGGSKANLITGWIADGNANQRYGRHRWLAQTFTLPASYHVWRCRLKSWSVGLGDFYHYALRSTDSSKTPIGTDIDHTTLSPMGEARYSPGKWRRFDFRNFPLLPPGTYALIASVPDSASPNYYALSSQEIPAGIPSEKAWRSDDDGETWEEIPDTTFLFDVWGWSPPPDAPPDPVLDNWAPTDLELVRIDDGYRIILTTSTPAHLYMRYSLIETQKHLDPVFRRGLPLHYNPRFCFVAWRENEQQEDGDTLIHTFIKENWPICQTRWFYFIGTRAGQQSPSVSPIFKKHRPPLATYTLYPTGDGFTTNIRFIAPTTPPTHWDKVRYEDATFDPTYGYWGIFAGKIVFEKLYYNDNFYYDLYSVSNIPPLPNPILSIKVLFRVSRNKYPYGKMKPMLRTYDITYESPEQDLRPYFEWREQEYLTNPFTGLPWTEIELNLLQPGIALGKAGGQGAAVCDAVKVEVYCEAAD